MGIYKSSESISWALAPELCDVILGGGREAKWEPWHGLEVHSPACSPSGGAKIAVKSSPPGCQTERRTAHRPSARLRLERPSI